MIGTVLPGRCKGGYPGREVQASYSIVYTPPFIFDFFTPPLLPLRTLTGIVQAPEIHTELLEKAHIRVGIVPLVWSRDRRGLLGIAR